MIRDASQNRAFSLLEAMDMFEECTNFADNRELWILTWKYSMTDLFLTDL